MKTFFAIAVLATGLAATPALADCASDLAAINAAVTAKPIDEANAAKAKELMDKATAAQAASDEAGCTAATTELKTLAGVPAQ